MVKGKGYFDARGKAGEAIPVVPETTIVGQPVKIDIEAISIGAIPISISSAAIVGIIPVNIQAQAVGNIAVDISAQTVGNLSVAVSGTAEIDIETQSVGVYLQPEWAALQSIDHVFTIDELTKAAGSLETLTYNVPGGRTLYICYVTAYGDAAPADADKDQMLRVMVTNFSTGDYLAHLGGNGGVSFVFPVPLVFSGDDGDIVRFYLGNRANHSMYMALTAGGYEV